MEQLRVVTVQDPFRQQGAHRRGDGPAVPRPAGGYKEIAPDSVDNGESIEGLCLYPVHMDAFDVTLFQGGEHSPGFPEVALDLGGIGVGSLRIDSARPPS